MVGFKTFLRNGNLCLLKNNRIPRHNRKKIKNRN
jgi:hypothetical protein